MVMIKRLGCLGSAAGGGDGCLPLPDWGSAAKPLSDGCLPLPDDWGSAAKPRGGGGGGGGAAGLRRF